ncbi:methyltransferase type 12 [Clostridium sp. CAG:277]|jgi:Methylase involved in ubiquinone/menaquinone biosynthesis|nr:methyltransferase type 12 [Clostridium sp. CAG:277]
MSEKPYNENAYNGFAYCYDLFMDNIPYDMWAEYLYGIFREQGITEGTLLELGCGTGTMTEHMRSKGYDSIIGLDCSEDMLMVARDKDIPDVLLIQQDMRELDLPYQVDAVYCVCDGMNYLLEPQDLQKVFDRVKRFLKAGGVFVFDMKTRHFYQDVLGNRMIAENRNDASFLWENEYHEDTGINEYLLTVYQLEDEERDLFFRCDELHYQKAYEPDEVRQLIQTSGLECCEVYEAFTKKSATPDSERVYFVVKNK